MATHRRRRLLNTSKRWMRLSGVLTLFIFTAISLANPIPLPGARILLEAQKLTAIGASADDTLGRSLASSSDGFTIIAGADQERRVTRTGYAVVFMYSGGTWQQQKLVGSDSAPDDEFGSSAAMSADGLTALVGAEQNDAGFVDAGAAYVFTRTGDTWAEQQKLVATDAHLNAQAGQSVALSADGNTAFVGAWQADDRAGAVYVFTRTGTVWTQVQKLSAGDATANHKFGDSVAVSQDSSTLLVGASAEGPGFGGGEAYVFTWDGSAWVEQQKLTASDPVENDGFGKSVTLSADGNVALIGSSSDENIDGDAYIFTRTAGVWMEQQKLTPNDPSPEKYYGFAVGLRGDGNLALVTARRDNAHRGAVYVFAKSGEVWSQVQKLVASHSNVGDLFGSSLALSSDANMIAIGTTGGDGARGAVYVFADLPFTTCAAALGIPEAECQALVDLYDSTGGVSWANSINWKTTNVPCSWSGITCLDGHVSGIDLKGNNLTGTLPASLGNLSQLKKLELSLNHLNGNLPATLGNLTQLTSLLVKSNKLTGDLPATLVNLTGLASPNVDLAYNGLTVADEALLSFLNTVDPDWAATQTVAPTNVQAVYDASEGIVVSWNPILYTGDGGYYNVTCASAAASTNFNTVDKTMSEVTFSGLEAGDYTCEVKTFTPLHSSNLNDILSSAASSGGVTYPVVPDTPPNDLFMNPILFDGYPQQNYSLKIANATIETDPLPPVGDPNCPVRLPGGAVAIHYRINGDSPGFENVDDQGLILRAGGPGWYRKLDGGATADTAIVVYELNEDDTLGAVIACADDDANGEVSVTSAEFDFDTAKNYHVVVWNEGAAPEGAIVEIALRTFDLKLPENNQVMTPPNKPLEFTWSAYAGTLFYYFEIARTSELPLAKLKLLELTADPDGDGLTCNPVTCTLTTAASADLTAFLSTGNYIWSVSAESNDPAHVGNTIVRYSNQINRLVIGMSPPEDLLNNGSFEIDNDGDKVPDGWNAKKLAGDKQKCNKPNKTFANEGVCAFQFKGGAGEKATLIQMVHDVTLVDGGRLASGDTLTLSVMVRGKKNPTPNLTVKVKAATEAGPVIKIQSVSDTYTLVTSEPVTLLADVTTLKIKIKHKSPAGKLFIDDVKLVANTDTRGLPMPLPLPEAASSLTGSH